MSTEATPAEEPAAQATPGDPKLRGTIREAILQVSARDAFPDRAAKLDELRKAGHAYPNDFRRDSLAADVHAQHGEKDNDTLESAALRVAVAGRMMLKR